MLVRTPSNHTNATANATTDESEDQGGANRPVAYQDMRRKALIQLRLMMSARSSNMIEIDQNRAKITADFDHSYPFCAKMALSALSQKYRSRSRH